MSNKKNDKYLENAKELLEMQLEDFEVSVNNLLDFPATGATYKEVKSYIKKIKELL